MGKRLDFIRARIRKKRIPGEVTRRGECNRRESKNRVPAVCLGL